MRISGWGTTNEGFEFSSQGETLDGLFLLFNGETSIKKDGEAVGSIHDGAMIEEISFKPLYELSLVAEAWPKYRWQIQFGRASAFLSIFLNYPL